MSETTLRFLAGTHLHEAFLEALQYAYKHCKDGSIVKFSFNGDNYKIDFNQIMNLIENNSICDEKKK